MVLLSMTAYAQSGTNSPYSQYGLGALSDQSTSFNRGMNGLSLGFQEHNQINYMNPASYAYLDSLSFIFDGGISGHITNFKEGDTKKNAQNANFEYIVAGLRLTKHLGMSFGLLPLTNIGYNYYNTEKLNATEQNSTVTVTNTYYGEGGLHQVYLGMGWAPFKGFSIGVNGSYLWGRYYRYVTNGYSDSYANTLSKYYSATIHNYRLDVGAQYTARLSKKNSLTVGVTFTPGHKLLANPTCDVVSTNSQTAVADTASYTIHNGLELPTMYGAGLMFNHDNRLKIGIDYSLQKWASTEYPVYEDNGSGNPYVLSGNMFKDRHKFTLGGDYLPQENSRNFLKRLHYRAGVSYATSYLKIDGNDGPKELSASVGIGIPIINGYNNRSVLNIAAQWVHQSSDLFITENTFRITIGFTFNERWFDKWKFE